MKSVMAWLRNIKHANENAAIVGRAVQLRNCYIAQLEFSCNSNNYSVALEAATRADDLDAIIIGESKHRARHLLNDWNKFKLKGIKYGKKTER